MVLVIGKFFLILILAAILVLALKSFTNSTTATVDNNNVLSNIIKSGPQYSYVLRSKQLFHDVLQKQKILGDLRPQKYAFDNVKYVRRGIQLDASHLVLSVQPMKVSTNDNKNNNWKDDMKVRLNIDINGSDLSLKAGKFSKYYSTLELSNSIYGVYDKRTD